MVLQPSGTAPPPTAVATTQGPAGGASLLALTCPPTVLRYARHHQNHLLLFPLRCQVFQTLPTLQAAETQLVSAPPMLTAPAPPPAPDRGTTLPLLLMVLLQLAEGFLSTKLDILLSSKSDF